MHRGKMSEDKNKYERVMDLAKKRGFIWPSFEIYGGEAGFYIVIIIERHKGDGHYRVQEIHPEDTDVAQ